MVDLYRNHPIDHKSDIWALGCLLYKLAYFVGPFDSGERLAILNGNYRHPTKSRFSKPFQNMIDQMLDQEPEQRPNTDKIITQIEALLSSQSTDQSSNLIEISPNPCPISVPKEETKTSTFDEIFFDVKNVQIPETKPVKVELTKKEEIKSSNVRKEPFRAAPDPFQLDIGIKSSGARREQKKPNQSPLPADPFAKLAELVDQQDEKEDVNAPKLVVRTNFQKKQTQKGSAYLDSFFDADTRFE
eukprot:TRINITY_DN3109_c0_g1_i1.p1 TRINITY_DN3109_c0_g1~~TRINITY_DN3109_c0_g1_i1.p1  ORF type:complete len:244 (-),score=48.23 TRINITY_DN3109_c0_g1_i1:64-795(-)